MSIISNSVYSPEIINVGGEFMTILLVIIFIISILLTDTKYWNRCISNTFDIFSNSLLLIFVIIVVYKVILIV